MTHPLLTPRYMVEADYPNSPYAIGDILLNYKDTHYRRVSDGYVFTEQKIQNYPHIFRPMHWSEQRELGEMPRYGKVRNGGMVVCISKWSIDGFRCGWVIDCPDFSWVLPDWVTPATEAEYLEYLKSKEK